VINKLVVDNNGVVREPHLHDAVVIGAVIEKDKVQFRFRTCEGTVVRISLINLIGLSLESMFEQNIVFEMRITPVNNAIPSHFLRVFHRTSDMGIGISESRLIELQTKNFVFVQIDPTLGADILALCNSVVWEYCS
jgi:hypothetical protein